MKHSLIDLRGLPAMEQRHVLGEWDFGDCWPDALICVSPGVHRYWMPGRVITEPSLAGGFS